MYRYPFDEAAVLIPELGQLRDSWDFDPETEVEVQPLTVRRAVEALSDPDPQLWVRYETGKGTSRVASVMRIDPVTTPGKKELNDFAQCQARVRNLGLISYPTHLIALPFPGDPEPFKTIEVFSIASRKFRRLFVQIEEVFSNPPIPGDRLKLLDGTIVVLGPELDLDLLIDRGYFGTRTWRTSSMSKELYGAVITRAPADDRNYSWQEVQVRPDPD
jgi:hypothetical protein